MSVLDTVPTDRKNCHSIVISAQALRPYSVMVADQVANQDRIVDTAAATKKVVSFNQDRIWTHPYTALPRNALCS